ncbi:MAG: hypothetical protein K2H68_07340, partial [Bacteroidales bacterium]|nr:hypothetical protein [Bacteroidales bacterium]
MKHLLRFIPLWWVALLLGVGVQAQETLESLPVSSIPVEEDNGNASGLDKWNAEGRLFLSLSGNTRANPPKTGKWRSGFKPISGCGAWEKIERASAITCP